VSFAYREASLLNRAELWRALRDDTYVPRFYRLTGGAPVTFWNSPTGEGADDRADARFVELLDGTPTPYRAPDGTTDSAVSLPVPYPVAAFPGATPALVTMNVTQGRFRDVLQRAVIQTLGSGGAAFDPVSLKRLWVDGVECSRSRAASCDRPRGPLRTDGLLYTPNALLALVRKASVSDALGQWDVRGALVAADLGVLATGPDPEGLDAGTRRLLTEGWAGVQRGDRETQRGLALYHDARLADHADLPSDERPVLVRGEWSVAKR
jgi:hypothetical protein